MKTTPTTKPCTACGTFIPVGYLACAPCQREWMRKWAEQHPHHDRRRS